VILKPPAEKENSSSPPPLLKSTAEHQRSIREDATSYSAPPRKAAGATRLQSAREFLALSYWKEKKLPVIVARLFNTVWPPANRPRYGWCSPISLSLSRQPTISILWQRQAISLLLRCAGYVEGLIRLMDTDRSIGEVINVGNTEEITIEALAQK